MKFFLRPLTALAVLAAVSPLAADTTQNAADTKEDELVKLSPFLVNDSASSTGRYASFESTSAGRIRTNLMDSSQSVSVITSELIQDVAGDRTVDAAKYVAGVTDSSLPTSWDRTNMRGFLADGRTVDGFTFSNDLDYGYMNLDPAIIERIDVIKGPNSILAPEPTSPGGTINNATKKPLFRDFGVIRLQLGSFDANSGFIDVNRALNNKLAMRVVASRRDWDNWWKGSSVRGTTIMPGLTYRFSDSAQITLQYIYSDWKATNYFGLPLDPTSGTTTKAHILEGVPLDLNVYAGDVFRADRQSDFKLLFTAELWAGIQMRLAAIYHRVTRDGPQVNTGPSTGGPGGNRDPLTGDWNYGLRYGQTPPYAPSPLPQLPTRIFLRSGIEPRGEPREFQVQNDYAYILENNSLKSTTLAGFACRDLHDNDNLAYNLSAPNLDIDHYADTPFTRGTLNYNQHYSSRFVQGYLSENLALFQDRLILNAANSWQSYDEGVHDLTQNVTATSSPRTSLPSYGIVIKPWKDAVSLYYGYTEQSSAIDPSTTSSGPALSTSQQKEFGGRIKLWNDRFYLTVAHFDISQDNYVIFNPGNFATPTPNPLLPNLYFDRKAKGWEYELRANPTNSLAIIASYTHFKNRDPYNVEFRGVAEKAGSLLVSYTFDHAHIPALAGFRAAVGVDYLGNRPGDTASGFTAASTPTHVIPNQPTFYLGARTLVNLILAYNFSKNWQTQLNVDNLLNKEYLWASNIRNGVLTGTPTNVRVSLRYLF